MIDDLYTLTLVDGLPAISDGKTIRYRRVKLRETTVGDERAAQRAAERVVMVGGVPKLMVSDAEFRFALTARHIEALHCDQMTITGPLIDAELLDKLTSHDMGLIEQRVWLINLAAEVRYGNLTQAQFDAEVLRTTSGAAPPAPPQPVGQVAGVGAVAPEPQPGPALLADYAGGAAGGPAACDAAAAG